MKRRIITSLVAIPIVLSVVASQTPIAFALILLACFLCLAEAGDLLEANQPALLDALPMLLLAVATGILNSPVDAASHSPGRDFGTPVLLTIAWGLWLTGLISSWRIARRQTSAIDRAFYSLWCGVPLLSLVFLHPFRWSLEPSWSLATPILLILIPVWAGDIAAMFAGKTFGTRLLAPSISPKKTWEGAIANLLAACIAGLIVGLLLGYSAGIGLACGAVVGIVGQMGDLFESALKRAAGKKDSGTLLPGHGGLLDRIDSLIACVLPVWLVLWLAGIV